MPIILTLTLKDLVAANPRPGTTIELTDVTTCAANSAPSSPTVVEFWVGTTKDQISGAIQIIQPLSKNVSMLVPNQSYTRAAGSRSLLLPSSVTAGPRFVIARLRHYPTVITSFPITINP